MSMPSPTPPGGPRASRGVKLVLMGVAGAALLYSCAPGVSAGLGALPYLWFLPNPFYRPPLASACPPGSPNCDQQSTQSRSGGSSSSSSVSSGRTSTSNTAATSSTQTAPATSQRGGFGSTGSTGSSGSS